MQFFPFFALYVYKKHAPLIVDNNNHALMLYLVYCTEKNYFCYLIKCEHNIEKNMIMHI